jgi:hypothetical protein
MCVYSHGWAVRYVDTSFEELPRHIPGAHTFSVCKVELMCIDSEEQLKCNKSFFFCFFFFVWHKEGRALLQFKVRVKYNHPP